MLGRLIRHEWQEVYKTGLLMLALICGVTIVGMLGFRSPVWNYIISEETEVNGLAAFAGIMSGVGSLFIYIFSLVGVTYGIMIYIGIHFYQTMYTDRGYLTQTLPVKPVQLLVSKLLVGGAWVVFVGAAVLFSVVILIRSVAVALIPEQTVQMSLQDFFRKLYWVYKQELGFDLIIYAVNMLLMFLIGPFMSISMLFGSITLGQLSRKHRGMMGIVAYFALMFVQSLFTMLVNILLMVGVGVMTAAGASGGNINISYTSSLISSLVFGVTMFFVAKYILENKLNMD